MKNTRVIHVIYLFIVGILVFLLVRTLFNKPVKSENNVAKIVAIDSEPAEIITDNDGNQHAQKQVIYVQDPSTIAGFQRQIDSLVAQLGIKDAHIRGITTAASSGTTEFKPTIKESDTGKNKVYSIDYKSRWLELKAKVPSDEPFKIVQRDSISIAFIQRGKTLFADISSANPDMDYYNVRSWQVPESKKKSKIGLGVTAGYGLQFGKNNDISHGLQVTGGLQFRF